MNNKSVNGSDRGRKADFTECGRVRSFSLICVNAHTRSSNHLIAQECRPVARVIIVIIDNQTVVPDLGSQHCLFTPDLEPHAERFRNPMSVGYLSQRKLRFR
jgi:hypothetical protein